MPSEGRSVQGSREGLLRVARRQRGEADRVG